MVGLCVWQALCHVIVGAGRSPSDGSRKRKKGNWYTNTFYPPTPFPAPARTPTHAMAETGEGRRGFRQPPRNTGVCSIVYKPPRTQPGPRPGDTAYGGSSKPKTQPMPNDSLRTVGALLFESMFSTFL